MGKDNRAFPDPSVVDEYVPAVPTKRSDSIRGKPNPVRPGVKVLPTEAEAGEVVVSAQDKTGRSGRKSVSREILIRVITQ